MNKRKFIMRDEITVLLCLASLWGMVFLFDVNGVPAGAFAFAALHAVAIVAATMRFCCRPVFQQGGTPAERLQITGWYRWPTKTHMILIVVASAIDYYCMWFSGAEFDRLFVGVMHFVPLPLGAMLGEVWFRQYAKRIEAEARERAESMELLAALKGAITL